MQFGPIDSKAWMLVVAVLSVTAEDAFLSTSSAQFVCVDGNGSAQGASATGSQQNFACGANAIASGAHSLNTAVGAISLATGTTSVNTAVGAGRASGDNSENIAVGKYAFAGGDSARNTSLGADSYSSGLHSYNVALGYGARATGDFSYNTAVGTSAYATGQNSIAVGANAYANGVTSIAIGYNAQAVPDNSIAIGNGVQTAQPNQVVVGNAINTYTFSGITSAASRAAQQGPTQVVTTDAAGNLASDGGALASGVSTAQATANAALRRADRGVQGVSMAFAMAGTPTLSAKETFALSANWGTFEGMNGLAFGAALRLDAFVQANAGIAYGMNDSSLGGRAGIRIGW